jgi:cytochrome c peroxidase
MKLNKHSANRSPQLRKLLTIAGFVCASAGLYWCSPVTNASDGPSTEPRSYVSEYKRAEKPPFPADNQFSAERELLGRTLFFDPRLSSSDWISCATCHNPAFSWGDGLAKGLGHNMKTLGRRTPTILNLAWAEPLFWDGRAQSLEEQALGPIAAPGEMNLPLPQLIAKLKSIDGYRPLFAAAYPGEPLSEQTVAKALATFERTVVSERAPFDRWVAGEEAAISEAAKRGFVLFNTKANCAKCHAGWRFTDDSFHDIGVQSGDPGRGKLYPEIEINQFAFKTPTLRNADRRAPYLHDGSAKTLQDVVELYDQGGAVKRPSLSNEIKPLKLAPPEKADLVAFLKTLTSVDKPVEIPALPR